MKIELTRDSIDTLLSLISDKGYSYSDGYEQMTISLYRWPTVDKRWYKKLNRLLKQYKDFKEIK